MRGLELISSVAAATGLPQNLIIKELSRLASNSGVNADQMTLDELRDLLAEYLQDVLLSAKQELREAK